MGIADVATRSVVVGGHEHAYRCAGAGGDRVTPALLHELSAPLLRIATAGHFVPLDEPERRLEILAEVLGG